MKRVEVGRGGGVFFLLSELNDLIDEVGKRVLGILGREYVMW